MEIDDEEKEYLLKNGDVELLLLQFYNRNRVKMKGMLCPSMPNI